MWLIKAATAKVRMTIGLWPSEVASVNDVIDPFNINWTEERPLLLRSNVLILRH